MLILKISQPCFLNSTVFWNITPYSSVEVQQRFGVTYHLHLHGRRINLPKTSNNQPFSFSFAVEACTPFYQKTRSYNPEVYILNNYILCL
jgi:hypothetical protein